MKVNIGKAALGTLLLLSAGFIITLLVSANDQQSSVTDYEVGTYAASSWDLPETVSFAGEEMPLQNFDTRESLDRELNATAYRHGRTLLSRD
jgi:hypothetical protein